jgi:hypothetical protein
MKLIKATRLAGITFKLNRRLKKLLDFLFSSLNQNKTRPSANVEVAKKWPII